MEGVISFIRDQAAFEAGPLHDAVTQWLKDQQIKPGDILTLLRIALTGAMKGPGVFDMMELLGKEASVQRLERALDHFKNSVS